MGAPTTVTAMERAMEAGHSVLIENMGENIDAVLNPVITRSTFKKVCYANRMPNRIKIRRDCLACTLHLLYSYTCSSSVSGACITNAVWKDSASAEALR